MITLFAFLHHLAAFALVAAMAIELVLIGQGLSLATAKRLIATDAVLGVAAGAVLVVGLCRVFFFEKGVDYYFHSHAFLMKLTVFILVGLVSIVPTREFLSWRKAVRAGDVPVVTPARMRFLKRIIHCEVAAIVLVLLGAAMMARGGWV